MCFKDLKKRRGTVPEDYAAVLRVSSVKGMMKRLKIEVERCGGGEK